MTRLAIGFASMMCAVLAAGCGTVPHGQAGGQALGRTAAGVTGAYFPATMSQIADGTDFQQTISTLEKELFEDSSEDTVRPEGSGVRFPEP